MLTYGLVTRFIERPRPEPVEQLDTFNLLHSYPSGHVAASVAIYGSLALLLAAHFKDIRARVAIWTVAAGFPLVVALSRIYRGEHHPIDVIAGALMGAAQYVVALFAARTARRVAELRHEKHARSAPPMLRPSVLRGSTRFRHEHRRGHRSFGQEPRRRPSRAAKGSRATAASTIRSGMRCPRAAWLPNNSAALKQGADLVFVWGGDGMVQRCVDVVAGSDATMAIVPAGTANLFASNLGIPKHIDEGGRGRASRRASEARCRPNERREVRRHGRRRLRRARDPRRNDQDEARARPKRVRMGGGEEPSQRRPFEAQLEVDGKDWYKDPRASSCSATSAKRSPAVKAFDNAQPDDGLLEIGVGSAEGILQWGRTLARSALSSASKSPFVHMTKGRSVVVKLNRKVLYELDGGDREKKKTFRVDVQPRRGQRVRSRSELGRKAGRTSVARLLELCPCPMRT